MTPAPSGPAWLDAPVTARRPYDAADLAILFQLTRRWACAPTWLKRSKDRDVGDDYAHFTTLRISLKLEGLISRDHLSQNTFATNSPRATTVNQRRKDLPAGDFLKVALMTLIIRILRSLQATVANMKQQSNWQLRFAYRRSNSSDS
jgi:hypothetical protein